MTEVTIKVLPAPSARRARCSASACPTRPPSRRCRFASARPSRSRARCISRRRSPERFSDQDIARGKRLGHRHPHREFPSSARYRAGRLKERLAAYSPSRRARHRAEPRVLGGDQDLARCLPVPSRRSGASPPRHPARRSSSPVIARTLDIRAAYDWSGGLVWLETPLTSDAGAVEIRRTLAEFGGHATLIRAETRRRARASTCSSRSIRRSRHSRRG